MSGDTKENIQKLWKEETKVRRSAHWWGNLANLGFIGLVATEIPAFFNFNERSAKSPLRLVAFIASGASVVAGVIGSWILGNKAEKMRESNLMVEHSVSESADAHDARKWRAAVAMEAQQKAAQGISK